nr:MAG TPA: biofilm formation stimulator [Bacteriophage sp.]
MIPQVGITEGDLLCSYTYSDMLTHICILGHSDDYGCFYQPYIRKNHVKRYI